MDMYSFNHSMTIVYNKNTGDIKAVIQGEQSTEEEDCDVLIKKKDNNIFDNCIMYRVNPETKQLELR